MNFKQFETLYWIARLGSFRAASRHLKMAQPTVSARIRELERELGVELFDRSSRSARLTARGRELIPYAEQIVSLASEIHRHLGNRDSVTGRVRLGVTSIPARTWLPKLIRNLARAHPGIELEFMVESSEHMRDLLLAGELDVAFLAGPVRTTRMTTDVIGQVNMAFLASPALGIPLTPVSPQDLESWPIISGPRGSHLHDLAVEWFQRSGAQLRYNHACSSLSTRIQLAVEGMGIAIATPSAAARELAEGKLRIVTTATPLAALEYVVAFPMVTLSPAVQIVAGMAKDLVAEKQDIHFYYAEDRETS
ncbi:MAG: LysR family transcriptional regulator [Proteobacteria bacterium]|nr:LysR family transcriptional regulator [Pseudomonadota bacterium]